MPATKSAVATKDIGLPPKDGGAVVMCEPLGIGGAVLNEAESFLAMIERASRDPTVDAAKMRAFLDMRLQLIALAAEEAFNNAMRDAQGEMRPIARDGKGERHKYAKLETIAQVLDPIIHRHGFSQSFGTADSPLKDHYRVTCKLSNGQHSRDYFADIPTDAAGPKGGANKTGTQAFGSTMSYARRYLTVLIFNVTIVDEDNDGNGVRKERRADEPDPNAPINDAQVQAIQRLIVKAAADITKFCAFFKIERVADLPVSRFEEARGMLNRKASPKGTTK